MTDTSHILQNHRSIRRFKADPIDPSILHDILKSAWRAPSSSNLQEVTAIVVKNPAKKEKIAKIAGGQPWIASCPVFICLVVDYYKTQLGAQLAKGEQTLENTMESIITGGVDTGIALSNMMAAAQSHGLGIVPIGGIRNNMVEMAELLELPPLCAPIVGMCLGHIEKDAQLKPRLAMDSFVHNETYNTQKMQPLIESYNIDLKKYWQDIGRPAGLSWSENLAENQEKFAKRHIRDDLATFGFFKKGLK